MKKTQSLLNKYTNIKSSAINWYLIAPNSVEKFKKDFNLNNTVSRIFIGIDDISEIIQKEDFIHFKNIEINTKTFILLKTIKDLFIYDDMLFVIEEYYRGSGFFDLNVFSISLDIDQEEFKNSVNKIKMIISI